MTEPITLTGQAAADAGRATLEAAGVDVDALMQRRELALAAERHTLLTAVQVAAQDVIDQRGTAGAMKRTAALRATLDALTVNDAQLAIAIKAALWLDRYGTAGAPERMGDMQDALDNLRPPTFDLHAIAERHVAMGLIEANPYSPPCDVDPVSHEERLAYLEPDDGQD